MTFDPEQAFNAGEQAPRRQRQAHPTGMEPGIKIGSDGTGEAVVAVPAGQDPAWDRLLEEHGWGDVLDVLEVTEVRSWETFSNEHGTQVLRYFRAKVRRRRHGEDQADIEEMVRRISRHRSKRVERSTGTERALVACVSDLQGGKFGTDAMVARFLRCIDAVAAKLKRVEPSRLVVPFMGDLVEGCSGHYPLQTFDVELDRREQTRLIRRLSVKALTTWAPLVPEVVCPVVPGNHGENRKAGKVYTSWSDNDDVAIPEQVGEILAANPDVYGHVSFVLPSDQDLTVTLDVYGVVHAFAHGHQCRRGASVDKKVMEWWKRMAHSRHPVGDADVLVTGHYHHLRLVEDGQRTWFQCPTLDSGSPWWEHMGGAQTVPGMLTYEVEDGHWRRPEVIR